MMRYVVAVATAGMILTTIFSSSVKADHSSVFLKISTWEIKENGEKLHIFAGAERTSIQPVGGRGEASDIDCEGQSNKKGIVACLIKHCDKSDPLRNSYLVNFKSPGVFVQVTPASIGILRCKVISEPVVAKFLERTIVAKLTQLDRELVFSDVSAIANGQLIKGVSETKYIEHLSNIIEQPLGVFRLANLRRLVQDASIKSLKRNDKSTALLYQRLATAYANVILKYSADQITPGSISLKAAGELSTLHSNISLTEKKWAHLATNIGNTPQARALSSYSSLLSELKDATGKGRLANFEFKQLEALAMSIQSD